MFVLPPEHSREQLSARPSTVMVVANQEQNYQNHHQIGKHFRQSGNPLGAQAEYRQAIREVERLRSQLRIEQRADFLADKQAIYEEMVELCLALEQPAQALTYVEMIKSRTLHDLLTLQANGWTDAESSADHPWLATLQHLRQARDQLVGGWQEQNLGGVRGNARDQFRQPVVQRAIADFEKRITTLWHNWRARTTNYLPKTAVPMPTEAVQACLGADAAMVEYFVIQGKLVAFVITATRIHVKRLPATLAQVNQLLDFLRLNLKTVAHRAVEQTDHLIQNATRLLKKLYDCLFAPLRDLLAPYHQLIIVPHGPLHQLPFHALYDGQTYLVEHYLISYLPRASLLPLGKQARPGASLGEVTTAAMFGYSAGGRLPYAVQEAQQVAMMAGGEAFLEEAATRASLHKVAEHCRLLHVATHGNFRVDNPLFSGLALADGWLTTLDTFELRLRASLVTLSACQSGCHLVAGGDELLGLIRAFLAAGAATVVAGLWAVEDQSTARLMTYFYRKLAAGATKGEALHYAQLSLLKGIDQADAPDAARYRHPYFWAPFFLVGDAGLL